MKKILNIAWKDLIIIFRDPSALLLMLGAPFVLTLGMGLVTGAFSDNDSNSGLADIPVVIVNEDGGQLGNALTDIFFQDDLADLLEPETATSASSVRDVSPTSARQQVDNNEIAAVVIIPAGFTDSIIPNDQTNLPPDAIAIEVYSNPGRPISASVVHSIVDDFVTLVDTRAAGIQVTIQQMAMNGRLTTSSQSTIVNVATRRFAQQSLIEMSPLIEIRQKTARTEPAEDNTNPLTYFAPAMAVAFLMYTVSLGGRSILAERDEGALARLLASPTSVSQVMGGKVSGIFLTGVAQVGVLILVSSLLFQLRWGNPLAVLLLIIAVSAAATGWGLLVAAISDRPGQVSSYGTALMLIFGILGGSFFQINTDGPLSWLSKITPNAWAIAWKDTVIRFFSKSELLFFLILPIVFTFLLGGALGGPGSETSDLRILLLVVDADQSDLSQSLLDSLQASAARSPSPKPAYSKQSSSSPLPTRPKKPPTSKRGKRWQKRPLPTLLPALSSPCQNQSRKQPQVTILPLINQPDRSSPGSSFHCWSPPGCWFLNAAMAPCAACSSPRPATPPTCLA